MLVRVQVPPSAPNIVERRSGNGVPLFFWCVCFESRDYPGPRFIQGARLLRKLGGPLGSAAICCANAPAIGELRFRGGDYTENSGENTRCQDWGGVWALLATLRPWVSFQGISGLSASTVRVQIFALQKLSSCTAAEIP